jgi:hypothetical protein
MATIPAGTRPSARVVPFIAIQLVVLGVLVWMAIP